MNEVLNNYSTGYPGMQFFDAYSDKKAREQSGLKITFTFTESDIAEIAILAD